MGLEIRDAETSEVYGKLTDVIKTGANDVYELKNAEGKAFYLPVIPDVVKEVAPEEGYVLITPMKGIFDDED
jgi:16S rRNA processing protein RimM